MNGLLNKICTLLNEDGKQLIDETPIVEFQRNIDNIQSNLAEILEEGRVLHLGIVGEVKAGKSSFLNALLFEGEDVLPKAPTPMTAALTKLSYSEVPEANIVFYSQDDWRGIERMTRQYDNKLTEMYNEYCRSFHKKQMQEEGVKRKQQLAVSLPEKQPKTKEEFERIHQGEFPMDWKACKEVYCMAADRGINIAKYLGQTETILQNDSSNDYLHRLSDYVGSKGQYTPIVKYTEIQLNNPNLKGVEVIDTPGLNDPVISRSRITQNFLMKCDAVFLLSYCGQFLGAEDINFITNALPNEGIRKAVLVGSKMDSAILQYPVRNASFKQAYLGTKRNCEQQAEKNISACKQNMRSTKIVEQMERSLPPICTSSIAFSAAVKQKKGQNLSAEEAHLLQQFSKRFSDFRESMLMDLSSIPDAHKKAFDETIAQKEQIIQERTQSFLASQKTHLLSDLEEIYIRTAASKSDLENFDCAQDEEQLKGMRSRLDLARMEVKSAFEKAATETQWSIKEIMLEAMDEMNNHLRIEVSSTTKTKHHSSTRGILAWKHTDHWDEIITTHSAEVRDAEENLRRYYNNCIRMINDGFKHMIKIESLKGHIKDSVMKAFEQHDQDFDEQRILIPLDSALSKLTLHDISVQLSHYSEMLDGKLAGIASGGTVHNEDIPELKRAQDQVLGAMAEDIQQLVKIKGEEIADQMNEQAALFIDGIVGELESHHKRLEDQIKNKKENLQKYENLLNELKNAKQVLQEADTASIFLQ